MRRSDEAEMTRSDSWDVHSCLCTLKEDGGAFTPEVGCQDSPGALATPSTRNSEEECDVYTVEVGMAEFPVCTMVSGPKWLRDWVVAPGA